MNYIYRQNLYADEVVFYWQNLYVNATIYVEIENFSQHKYDNVSVDAKKCVGVT